MVGERGKKSCCRGYQLILMDINMPLMNGIEATQRIRALENEAGIPRSAVVALTAADTDRSSLGRRKGELGFDELLAKPLSKNAFCLTVNRFLVASH